MLPEFAQEIEDLLKAEGEDALATQVRELQIVDRCRCGDEFCATFYVPPKPEGSYGPSHLNIELPSEHGQLILDVVDGEITAVEVLHRNEIRQKLHAVFS